MEDLPTIDETGGDRTFDHEAKLKVVPHEPGCYLMKDRRGTVVYIGKAKDLNDRVRTYFQSSGDNRMFVDRLPYILGDIETIVTENEKEALLLENTLIKKHKPRFNVRLKDDKNYLSLRIDLDHEWPRVDVVRSQDDDGAVYFGPYQSATAIRRTLNVLNKYFKLRTCPDTVLNNRDRPCLQHQINRCPAPCVLDIDRDEYMEHVDEAILFLKGEGDKLIEKLKKRMFEASDDEEFELAAHYRDQIRSIETVLEQQLAVSTDQVDRDVFGLYREGERLTIQVLFIRSGKLQGAKSFHYTEQAFPNAEVISSFINLYYNAENDIPRQILLPVDLPESELASLTSVFSDSVDYKVEIKRPIRGEPRQLIETANTNAEHSFRDENAGKQSATDTKERLQNALGLQKPPARIECYDISNLRGSQIVGSKVAFQDGKPDKSGYRRYKLEDVTGQDDFASMREVLGRRFRKVASGEEAPPDLVVIDGGKGQLSQAETVFEDLGIYDVDLISLAKPQDNGPDQMPSKTGQQRDRVFIPGRKNPILLERDSRELYLLQQVRDEAHRFAVTYHKKLRRRDNLHSSIQDIAGVGPRTKQDLLRHFGSLADVKEADLDQLTEVEGIGPKTAERIYEFYAGVRH